MVNLYDVKAIRKTVPIYEKINPIKLMDWVKVFSQICHIKFNCQIFTKNSDNKWRFQYHANNEVSISLYFCDIQKEPYPFISIDDFTFSDRLKNAQLDQKILKAIIHHIKNLDFEMLVFCINQSYHIELCKKNGFKEMDMHKMILSLKPKFIHVPTTNHS
ncbi:hypothetical protein [Crassaminicella profunda]|uniref:hypothetical protein n=1 Tax=Crassaminicella profunda TaxID=1286698 RepID=UPI001CA6FBDA|nr:hypothetical protein [Crassaminicella profunda]QZY57215.1 hypothetical protein K7H06_09975 [Crassaminicella profunda]